MENKTDTKPVNGCDAIEKVVNKILPEFNGLTINQVNSVLKEIKDFLEYSIPLQLR